MEPFAEFNERPVEGLPVEALEFDRLAVERGHDFHCLAGEQPYRRGAGHRVDLAAPEYRRRGYRSGYSDLVKLADGFFLRLYSASFDRPLGSVYLGEDWLKLIFRTSGRERHVFDRHGAYDHGPNRLCVQHHARDITRETWEGGAATGTGVTLYCGRAFLRGLLGPEPGAAAGPLAAYLGDPARSWIHESRPMTAAMIRVVGEIIDAPFSGALRHAWLEAKGVELLCLTIDADPREAAVEAVTPRELERLHEARRRILSCPESPPTIAQLARTVGLNRTRLKAGFRQVFGVTVFEMSQQHRLELAWQMLTESCIPVADVAERVGYCHAKNFSAAFKRHFRISPRAARRRVKALDPLG